MCKSPYVLYHCISKLLIKTQALWFSFSLLHVLWKNVIPRRFLHWLPFQAQLDLSALEPSFQKAMCVPKNQLRTFCRKGMQTP